ncbi:MAG: DUF3892 domain-containing protein [Pseudomonadales bacterium]|nr:DUF3892 domain-containing protein [Pseudomonadales bacterium]
MATKRIVDAQADESGNITGVRFRGSTRFTSVEIAIRQAERGEIENAHAVTRRDGSKYLRSNPDDKEGNNLDELAKK